MEEPELPGLQIKPEEATLSVRDRLGERRVQDPAGSVRTLSPMLFSAPDR